MSPDTFPGRPRWTLAHDPGVPWYTSKHSLVDPNGSWQMISKKNKFAEEDKKVDEQFPHASEKDESTKDDDEEM